MEERLFDTLFGPPLSRKNDNNNNTHTTTGNGDGGGSSGSGSGSTKGTPSSLLPMSYMSSQSQFLQVPSRGSHSANSHATHNEHHHHHDDNNNNDKGNTKGNNGHDIASLSFPFESISPSMSAIISPDASAVASPRLIPAVPSVAAPLSPSSSSAHGEVEASLYSTGSNLFAQLGLGSSNPKSSQQQQQRSTKESLSSSNMQPSKVPSVVATSSNTTVSNNNNRAREDEKTLIGGLVRTSSNAHHIIRHNNTDDDDTPLGSLSRDQPILVMGRGRYGIPATELLVSRQHVEIRRVDDNNGSGSGPEIRVTPMGVNAVYKLSGATYDHVDIYHKGETFTLIPSCAISLLKDSNGIHRYQYRILASVSGVKRARSPSPLPTAVATIVSTKPSVPATTLMVENRDTAQRHSNSNEDAKRRPLSPLAVAAAPSSSSSITTTSGSNRAPLHSVYTSTVNSSKKLRPTTATTTTAAASFHVKREPTTTNTNTNNSTATNGNGIVIGGNGKQQRSLKDWFDDDIDAGFDHDISPSPFISQRSASPAVVLSPALAPSDFAPLGGSAPSSSHHHRDALSDDDDIVSSVHSQPLSSTSDTKRSSTTAPRVSSHTSNGRYTPPIMTASPLNRHRSDQTVMQGSENQNESPPPLSSAVISNKASVTSSSSSSHTRNQARNGNDVVVKREQPSVPPPPSSSSSSSSGRRSPAMSHSHSNGRSDAIIVPDSPIKGSSLDAKSNKSSTAKRKSGARSKPVEVALPQLFTGMGLYLHPAGMGAVQIGVLRNNYEKRGGIWLTQLPRRRPSDRATDDEAKCHTIILAASSSCLDFSSRNDLLRLLKLKVDYASTANYSHHIPTLTTTLHWWVAISVIGS
jgi:hypothetical protein